MADFIVFLFYNKALQMLLKCKIVCRQSSPLHHNPIS